MTTYTGRFEEISSLFPRFMSAAPDIQMPDGWLSDFILECLNIPRVKIKESKKEESSADRLSIRDLLKLMYLKQPRVGSDNLLDYANPVLYNKNIEVQKFVFNVHNEALTLLKGELSAVAQERNALLAEREAVRKFLKSVNIQVSENETLDAAIEEKETALQSLVDDIENLKDDFNLTSAVAVELKNAIENLKTQSNKLSEEVREVEFKRNSYIKLRETYKVDLDDLMAAKYGRAIVGDIPRSLKNISCPLCESALSLSPNDASDTTISNQIRSIKNRIAGVDESVSRLLIRQNELKEEELDVNFSLKDKVTSFDKGNFAAISGLLQSIEIMENARTDLQVEIVELRQAVSIHRRFSDIDSSLENKAATIDSLRRSIADVESGIVDLEKVIEDLSGVLALYMRLSGLRNISNVYFDNRFAPHFRGISYYKATSGGVRTVLSIGSYLARLQYLIQKGGNLPTFLMIDTPGQNIGHNRRGEEDFDEEASDPEVYERVYEQIQRVIAEAKAKEKICQVIVVDNDLPAKLAGTENFHLVKRFSKSSKVYPRGLIDDADFG